MRKKKFICLSLVTFVLTGCIFDNPFHKSTVCRNSGIVGCVNHDKTENLVLKQKDHVGLSALESLRVQDVAETNKVMEELDNWCPMRYKDEFDDAIITIALNEHLKALNIGFSRRLQYICWARATHVLGARPYYEPLKVFQDTDEKNMVIWWENDDLKIDFVDD